MSDILMPALSPTMEEGGLAKWLVAVGDRIVPGQVIAEVETEKATLEVEATEGGVIEVLLVEEGAQGVPINTPIARLVADAPQTAVAEKEPAPSPSVSAKADIGPETQTPADDPITPAPSPPVADMTNATPLARKLAAASGVSFEGRGSGADGRILKRDLDKALGLGTPAQSAPVAERSPEAAGSQPHPSAGSVIPLDGMRKAIARRMTASFRDVPHFPLTVDIEIDALLALRAELNTRFAATGVKASVNDLIIKAVAQALHRVPEANASYSPGGILLHHDVDIAFAVAIEGGLITPIVRKAHEKSVEEIAKETRALAERARARRLAPAEFEGGTFSISNLGMFGIKIFTSIINEPQGAILSVGAAEKRPVVRNDEIGIATILTATLTCDHRAMDGVIGAQWVRVFKSLIEQPAGELL